MTARLLDSLTPAEILPAVLAEVRKRGHAEWSDVATPVAGALDSSYVNTGAKYRWDTQKIQVRFEGRVKRALQKLADEGKLVRKDNAGYRGAPMYYTPEKWAEQQAEAEKRLQDKRTEVARWDRIRDRLGEQGFVLNEHQGLRAGSWERLLDRLEGNDNAKGDSTDV